MNHRESVAPCVAFCSLSQGLASAAIIAAPLFSARISQDQKHTCLPRDGSLPLSHTRLRAVISPLERRALVRRQFKWHIHLCGFNEEIRGGDGQIGAGRGTGLASGHSFGCWLWKPREGGKEGNSNHSPPPSPNLCAASSRKLSAYFDERRTPTGCLRGTLQLL